MTSEHFDCISKEEYARRINAIADALQKISDDLVLADSPVPSTIRVRRTWAAAAGVVRAAVTPQDAPEATPEARLGMSTLELMMAREARASARLDGETHVVE